MKKTASELVNLLGFVPTKEGSRWRHNKTGVHYNIVGNTIDCKTNEVQVNYVKANILGEGTTFEDTLLSDVTFSRPLSSWLEVVDNVERFTKVREYSMFLSVDEAYEVLQTYKRV